MPPMARVQQRLGGDKPMSMERARRDRFTTQVPLTWEVPATVIGAVVFFVQITPLVVQGVVVWAVSGEFAWPSQRLGDAYGGLLHGHFGGGLDRATAGGLPSDAVMWVLTVLGEVVVLVAVVVVGLWARDLTGRSTSRRGLATATQAAEALGLPRLRKTAAVIRPDLYGRGRRGRSGPGRQQMSTPPRRRRPRRLLGGGASWRA